MYYLSYWFDPPGTAAPGSIRSFDSWEKISARSGTFKGDFQFAKGNPQPTGVLKLHTFALSWPGKPQNRPLDNEMLESLQRLIVRCIQNCCYFVPIFTTWSDENVFHAAHFNSWLEATDTNNSLKSYIVPIVDTYRESHPQRFLLMKNMELAKQYFEWTKQGTNSSMFQDAEEYQLETIQLFGGKYFSNLSNIWFYDILEDI
jgi:hypothetical protein